jgi:prephenate dehydrogenase
VSTLVLVGTGLIGGSFALAARDRGLFDKIIGIDRDSAALAEAQAAGVIDGTKVDGNPAAICVAVPTGQIADCVAQMAACHTGVPLFDVGSVKTPIIESLRARGVLPSCYVPCHPIAGSERRGVTAARADMFEGRSIVITPVYETARTVVNVVGDWWRRIGGEVAECDPGKHDRIVAATSHLPHLVAFALMEVLADVDAADLRTHIGAGFLDFSRIALSDPIVWSDILYDNRELIRAWAEKLLERVSIDADKDVLKRRIERARALRNKLT